MLFSISELKESFSLYDRNDEGMITTGDVSFAIRSMGQNPTEAECNELVQDIDLNGKSLSLSLSLSLSPTSDVFAFQSLYLLPLHLHQWSNRTAYLEGFPRSTPPVLLCSFLLLLLVLVFSFCLLLLTLKQLNAENVSVCVCVCVCVFAGGGGL